MEAPRYIPRIVLQLGLAVALAMSGPSLAQTSPNRDRVEHRIFKAFDQERYQEALELIEAHLAERPGDASMLYNLACAHCQLGNDDEAATALLKAFKAGFRDIDHLRDDPDLRRLRDHPTYKAILEAADKAAETKSRTALEQWRVDHDDASYRYETDSERRLHFATALDEDSHRDVRDMLRAQSDLLCKLLFEAPPRYYVLVAVPTPEDADVFFNGNDSIGGMYEHGPKRLVSRDIGSSLRHEFVHALHFGHMARLRQAHPLWIQEGLATLFEDYEVNDQGEVRFLPNDRQIVIRARANGGRLIRWSELFSFDGDQFMDRAGKLYPQVRSMFEFIAHRGHLVDWYKAYTSSFNEDRSGVRAFEEVFGKPIKDIEQEWRRWILDQPEVDLHIGPGDAALGVQSGDNLSNDGVLVTGVLAGSAAARSGVRKGDTIVSLDGKPTRTMVELRRLVASRKVGEEVTLRVRRRGEYIETRVLLRPLYGGR